jgi:tRNA A-37 threonylcarbamoyl transferase component Bud32/tetratricopeptide (TPR) repeat protein
LTTPHTLRRADLKSFRLERELGAGATGTVHLARLRRRIGGRRPGERVAVKFLHHHLTRDQRAREAFLREARAGLAVRHPNLVRIHAVEETALLGEDVLFLVMDFVEGETLRALLESHGALSEGLVRRAGAQVARALSALHRRGIVHLDVKPENVRLTSDGRVVLMDLGFARSFRRRAGDGESDLFGGSIAYAPPERLRGRAPDPRSDLYSLGATLYELACGKRPFRGPDLAAVVRGHLEETPPPPSSHLGRISPFLDRLVAWCLEKAIGDRPADADSLASLLEKGEASAWWQRESGRGGARSTVEDRWLPRADHLLPFVGREEPIGILRRAFDRVREGERRAVVLSGPAGIGKTRLAEEFVSRLAAESPRLSRGTAPETPRYLYGRCPRSSEAAVCAPFVAMLERYLGLPRGMPATPAAAARLRALVGGAHARALLQLLGAPSAPRRDEGDPFPAAIARFLSRIGAERPFVVFVDDADAADGSTVRTVAALLEDSSPPFLLLLAHPTGEDARERASRREALDLFAALDRAPRVDRLPLPALSSAQIARLVERLFPPSSPREEIARALEERTAGNPGLLAEILRAMRGEGRLSESEGLLVPQVPPDAFPHPRSLEEAARRTVESLPAQERRWIERAALGPDRVEPDLLAKAFDANRIEVLRVLARLERVHRHLASSGAAFRFARPLLREAIVRALPQPQRRDAHRRFAIALERAAQGRRLPLREALAIAEHASSAADHRRALRYLPRLVEESLRRGLLGRTARLARLAIDHLNAFPRTAPLLRRRVDLLLALAEAERRSARREEERRAAEKAARISRYLGDSRRLARSLLAISVYGLETGKPLVALGFLERAGKLFESAGDTSGVVETEFFRAFAFEASGELHAALRVAERAAARAPSPKLAARTRYARGRLLGYLDRPTPAMRDLLAALAAFRRLRDGIREAAALLALAETLAPLGALARAEKAARQALEIAMRFGERRLRTRGESLLGGVLAETGGFEEAARRLDHALEASRDAGDRIMEIRTRIRIAGLHLEEKWGAAEAERARRESSLALAAARDLDLPIEATLALAARARARLRLGEIDEAASDVLERRRTLHGTLSASARLRIAWARWLTLRLLGRREEAEREIFRAERLLRARAKRIEDPEIRLASLSRDPVARALEDARGGTAALSPR